jgi:hypothetical protein
LGKQLDLPRRDRRVARLLWRHLTQLATTLGARLPGVGAKPRAEGFDQRTGMVSQEEFATTASA